MDRGDVRRGGDRGRRRGHPARQMAERRPSAAGRGGEAAGDVAARSRCDREVPRGWAGVAGADERGAAEGGGVVTKI